MHPKYKDIGSIEDRLIEEMAELTKEICKARRFGYENYHPDDPDKITNKTKIEEEMSDVVSRIQEYREYLTSHDFYSRISGEYRGPKNA